MKTITQELNEQRLALDYCSDDEIRAAFARFINQRPGYGYADYWGEYRPEYVRAYNAERKSIWRDKVKAESQLWRVDIGPINKQYLAEALTYAFSGRLSAALDESGALYLDYTTGQMFATEYRKSAYAVLVAYHA